MLFFCDMLGAQVIKEANGGRKSDVWSVGPFFPRAFVALFSKVSQAALS